MVNAAKQGRWGENATSVSRRYCVGITSVRVSVCGGVKVRAVRNVDGAFIIWRRSTGGGSPLRTPQDISRPVKGVACVNTVAAPLLGERPIITFCAKSASSPKRRLLHVVTMSTRSKSHRAGTGQRSSMRRSPMPSEPNIVAIQIGCVEFWQNPRMRFRGTCNLDIAFNCTRVNGIKGIDVEVKPACSHPRLA